MGCSSGKASIEELNKKRKHFKKPVPFQRDSKIAIIGAGAGGITMAVELKKKGYNNITIFEMADRVGGKANTILVDNKHYDLGTVFTYSDQNVTDLLKEIGEYENFTRIDIMKTLMYTQNKLYPLIDYVKTIKNFTNLIDFKMKFDEQLAEFSKIFSNLVDEYGFPNPNYITELIKPVDKFFTDLGMEVLYEMVKIRLNSQGYNRGGLSLYNALFFLQPEFLGFEAILLECKNTLGWQNVWEKTVKVFDLKIEFNKKIESVEYLQETGKINLSITDTVNSSTTSNDFDFCVFGIEEPNRFLKNPTYKQKTYLEKFNQYYPILTTVYKIKNTPKISMLYDLNPFDTKGITTGMGIYRKHPDDDEFAIDVAYQYVKIGKKIENDDINYIETTLFDHINVLLNQKVSEKIYSKANNNYMPHCSVSDIEAGVPWEVFNLQGENNMWFTSAFTCFDLTESIIKYNKKILNQYDF